MNILISALSSLIDKVPIEHLFYKNLQIIKERLIDGKDITAMQFEIHSSNSCRFSSKNLLSTYKSRFQMLNNKTCTYIQTGLEDSIEVLTKLPNTNLYLISFDTSKYSLSLWLDENNVIQAFVCIEKV